MPAFFSARSISGTIVSSASCTLGRPRRRAVAGLQAAHVARQHLGASFTSGKACGAADQRLRHRLGEALRLHQRLAGGGHLRASRCRPAQQRARAPAPSRPIRPSAEQRRAGSAAARRPAAGRSAAGRRRRRRAGVGALQAGLGEVGDLGRHRLGDDRRCRRRRCAGLGVDAARPRCRRGQGQVGRADRRLPPAVVESATARRRRAARIGGAFFWPQPLILFTKLIVALAVFGESPSR